MTEITLFQGIAAAIFGSITVVGLFLRIARDLEKDAEKIVEEKTSVLDEHFFKSLSAISSIAFYRFVRSFGQIQAKNKKFQDILKTSIGEYVDEVLKLGPEEIEEQIYKAEIPPEIVKLFRLRDEDKDRLFNISFLAFQLKETVPEISSSIVDRMTKGIVFGIICGILTACLDLLPNFNLMQYFSLMSVIILLTGLAHFYWGIFGIWHLRKFEKKLKELKREEDLNSIFETVMEIAEYE